MSINRNALCIFDFETGSLETGEDTQPIQLAAIILYPTTLKQMNGAEFSSLIKPTDFSKLEAKALEINKKKIEDLEKAPTQEQVWKDFVYFVNQYNLKKTEWTAPIPVGHNICGFDLKIVDTLSKRYKTGTIFNRFVIDTMQILFSMFESSDVLKSYSQDSVAKALEIKTDDIAYAHDALQDVHTNKKILERILRFNREVSKRIKIVGSKG